MTERPLEPFNHHLANFNSVIDGDIDLDDLPVETIDLVRNLLNLHGRGYVSVPLGKFIFPTFLRKMWSGSEVQDWINKQLTPYVSGGDNK